MLSSEQVDMISVYCENRGVVYYDVQLELVDHIADITEQLQAKNPQLQFEEALEIAGNHFSKTEFTAIVENKKDQLLGRFVRLWRKEFYAYFTVPKLAFTLALVAATVWVTQLDDLEKFPSIAVHLINMINLFYVFGRDKMVNQIKQERRRSLLVFQLLNKRHVLLMLPAVFYLVLTIHNLFHLAFLGSWVYKTAVWLFPVFVLICLAWKKMYVDQLILIKENYPNAFAS